MDINETREWLYNFIDKSSQDNSITELEAKREFYKTFSELHQNLNIKIYMCCKPFENCPVKNCMDTVEFEVKSRSFLFFIDPTPRANWAHDCAYILFHPRKLQNYVMIIESEWPPHEDIKLERIDFNKEWL